MPQKLNITAFFILLFLFISCDNNKVELTGNIDYLGEAHIILQEQPIHYKYAPVVRDTFSVSETGSFSFVTTGTEQIKTLIINDESYPLILSPGKHLDINISRSDFPQEVNIKGYSGNWDERYNSYLNEISSIETQIPIEEEKIKAGEKNNLLELSKNKYQIAESKLNDTPLRDYYLKAIGEYLVFKVRAIEYNQRFFEDFDAEAARKEVFAEADSLNFFTIESLEAQRAGIRDFAHYFARTFGVYDSVKKAYGQEDLAEYDIKRLAYEELNEKRLRVLEHIKTRDALAHARMYLVAERIGEQPLEVAKPSYEAYLTEFSDYPKYTEFLTYFFNEIKSVSPGQPAIPFSLPDLDGDIHTMNDYHGKFVLLDFWAGWCQPCLEEFSYMKDIYAEYSRDELEIIGISNEVDSLVWVQDLERFDLPWVQLYSGKGFNEETFKAYKGGGIPFYILVDPEGKIARYNDIRPSFNFNPVLDSLLSQHKNQLN